MLRKLVVRAKVPWKDFGRVFGRLLAKVNQAEGDLLTHGHFLE